MKLQRLAGFGPVAAFISAIALVVVAVFQQVSIPPSAFVPAVITFLLAFFVWTAGLTVTLFDLEWLEHPATSTALFRVALGAILIAMVMPGVIALIVFAGAPIPLPIPWALLLGGVGVSLLIHNIEGRRARLIRGVLPWIGIVAGAGFVYLAILQFIFLFTPALVMGFFYGLPLTQVLYLVWAVWMGVHLMRHKAPARATATA
jgi:hypothetical protein